MVGSRLLLFGGSMHTCSELAWLDLEACAWGQPAALAGNPPCDRMSATAVLAGSSEVLIYGGYSFNHREVRAGGRASCMVEWQQHWLALG
jgi:hypothetical protein